MRLTNLNCPQCGGFLNQQTDKFYCSSCGAAFNVDYDEADVEYARLVTEADRTRLLMEKDRILLEKNRELNEKFRTRETVNVIKHVAKSQGTVLLGNLFLSGIICLLTLIITLGTIGLIGYKMLKKEKKDNAEKSRIEQERIELFEDLSDRDLEKDRNLIENAIAAGSAYEVSRRTEAVSSRDDDEGDAYLKGMPQAVSCFAVKNEKDFDLYIVYEMTYEYSDTGNTNDIFECVLLEKIEPDGTGHFTCDYGTAKSKYDDNCDWHWMGYEDQEYILDNMLPSSGKVYKLDITEGGEA